MIGTKKIKMYKLIEKIIANRHQSDTEFAVFLAGLMTNEFKERLTSEETADLDKILARVQELGNTFKLD
jgi:hypothetical protein